MFVVNLLISLIFSYMFNKDMKLLTEINNYVRENHPFHPPPPVTHRPPKLGPPPVIGQKIKTCPPRPPNTYLPCGYQDFVNELRYQQLQYVPLNNGNYLEVTYNTSNETSLPQIWSMHYILGDTNYVTQCNYLLSPSTGQYEGENVFFLNPNLTNDGGSGSDADCDQMFPWDPPPILGGPVSNQGPFTVNLDMTKEQYDAYWQPEFNCAQPLYVNDMYQSRIVLTNSYGYNQWSLTQNINGVSAYYIMSNSYEYGNQQIVRFIPG